MDLYAIQIIYKKGPETNILKTIYNLKDIQTEYRADIKSFWEYMAKFVSGRSTTNQSIQIEIPPDYRLFMLIRQDGLVVSLFTDSQYPNSIAQELLYKVSGDFAALIPRLIWTFPGKLQVLYASLHYFLKHYQKPSGDRIAQSRSDFYPLEIVVYDSMEAFLGPTFSMEQLRLAHQRDCGSSLATEESVETDRSCCGIM
jgi:hypothetical protein